MLTDQIEALKKKESELEQQIELLEEDYKSCKEQFAIVKKARMQLEKLEEQLNGQTTVSDQQSNQS